MGNDFGHWEQIKTSDLASATSPVPTPSLSSLLFPGLDLSAKMMSFDRRYKSFTLCHWFHDSKQCIGDDISIKSSNIKLNINNVCNLISHTKRAI